MLIKCCSCKKEYGLKGNIFESGENSNCPLLVCPYCGFKHIINFMPFENKTNYTKKVGKLDLAPYYVLLGATRIADANRVSQSTGDDASVIDWVKTNDFILAIMLTTNSKNITPNSYSLDWRDVTTTGTFAAVSSGAAISWDATTVLVNDAIVSSGEVVCDPEPGDTWEDGKESAGDNLLPSTGTQDLTEDHYTEYHWALSCDGAIDGHEYEFEVNILTNGTSLSPVCTLTMEAGPTPQVIEGVLTFLGNVTRSTPKGLFGAITFIGNVIATLQALTEAIAGVLTFAGSLSLQIKKNLASSLSFVGIFTIGLKGALLGVVSFAAQIIKKIKIKVGTG